MICRVVIIDCVKLNNLNILDLFLEVFVLKLDLLLQELQ